MQQAVAPAHTIDLSICMLYIAALHQPVFLGQYRMSWVVSDSVCTVISVFHVRLCAIISIVKEEVVQSLLQNNACKIHSSRFRWFEVSFHKRVLCCYRFFKKQKQ